jgi:LmbE family N-acetylglucosaminyl deacetylase
MKILVLSPHPDDAEIAMGSMIHHTIKNFETEVHIAVFTGEGALGMVHSGKTVEFTQRKVEQCNAADAMGMNPMYHLKWLEIGPASEFDMAALNKAVGALDYLIDQEKYDEIYVPLRSHNQDHNYVYEAAMAATRPGRCDKTAIYLYEQPTQFHGARSLDVLGGRVYFRVEPEDIEAQYKAVLCHKSQMEGREDTLSGWSGVMRLAELRGAEIGHPAAVMVHLMRMVL